MLRLEKHIASLVNCDSNCIIEKGYVEIILDDIDIMKLLPPQSKQQQLDSIESRQNVLRKMAFDSVYDEKTRARIKSKSEIPIKNDYISPLERLLQSKGLNVAKPYRVWRSPMNRNYIFQQTDHINEETDQETKVQ